MNDIATSKDDSILRDTVEAVKHFSWDTVTIELQMKTPTLMQLLRSLVRNPAKSKPFIDSIACQLLKDNHPKLGLMQRAVSVLFYANGTSRLQGGNFHLKVGGAKSSGNAGDPMLGVASKLKKHKVIILLTF